MLHDRIETTHTATRRRALDSANVSAIAPTVGMAGAWPADPLHRPSTYGVRIVTEPMRESPAVRVYTEAAAGWASVALSPSNARRLGMALIEAAAVVDAEHRW